MQGEDQISDGYCEKRSLTRLIQHRKVEFHLIIIKFIPDRGQRGERGLHSRRQIPISRKTRARLAVRGGRVITPSTPSCIYTSSARVRRYNSNRALRRISVLCAPSIDERGRRSSLPAALSPFIHPRLLPAHGFDVILTFSFFPSSFNHVMAPGAFEEHWLVVAHRDEVVSETGGCESSGRWGMLTSVSSLYTRTRPATKLRRSGHGLCQTVDHACTRK